MRLKDVGRRAAGFRRDLRGAAAVEYGLLIAGFTVLIYATSLFFGDHTTEMQTEVAGALKSAETQD